MDSLIDASAWVLPLLIAVTFHEAAHGWMARRFGDDTALRAGRLTFNPLRHIDRFGTLLLPGLLLLAHSPVLFGYAKPVPVDFRRLRPARLGMAAVALAGPGINLLLALLSGLALHVERFVTPEQAPWLFMNLYRSLAVNCVLMLFNLFPLLPLDGGRVVASALPGGAARIYAKTERFGMWLIFALLLIPALLGIDTLQRALGDAVTYVMGLVLVVTGNGE